MQYERHSLISAAVFQCFQVEQECFTHSCVCVQTLVVKVGGVICSVVGGLAVGKVSQKAIQSFYTSGELQLSITLSERFVMNGSSRNAPQ